MAEEYRRQADFQDRQQARNNEARGFGFRASLAHLTTIWGLPCYNLPRFNPPRCDRLKILTL
jgi:hypothetical protein